MNKTTIIAEIGINHNGDIELAKKLIDVSSAAGCDFVKFQKRDIDSCYTSEELDTLRESPWGSTFRHQKEGLEFGEDEYSEIDRYCKTKGIGWFASPWDYKSIEFLKKFNMPFIKIPSAKVTNDDFVRACIDYGKPVVASVGMCDLEMVDKFVNRNAKNIACLMHCTSTYPSKPDEMSMGCITAFRHRYPFVAIGFSNHSPGIIYLPIAVALGARMVEFHITLDRSSYGSDQAASIEPQGVFHLVKWIRDVEKGLSDKKVIYKSELPIIAKLRR